MLYREMGASLTLRGSSLVERQLECRVYVCVCVCVCVCKTRWEGGQSVNRASLKISC